MKQIEFEIERDNIDLSYDEKESEYRQKLMELDVEDADMRMKLNSNQMERVKQMAFINTLEDARRKELLQLKRDYLLNLE